jgi:hypothetical protein
VKSDGDEGRSYDGTTILEENAARVGAQSKLGGTCGLVGVKGTTSIVNNERDKANSHSNMAPGLL